MKKIICILLALSMCVAVLLTACGETTTEKADAAFEPALDTATACQITVAGSYDNFEALETEFEKFNEIYPNVKFRYVKLDDYNNVLATALDGKDKPNIFFSNPWMVGNEKYDAVCDHMEELSDEALGLDLDCIRPGLVNHDAKGRVMMVPVFSRTYGMLVNNDLFKKEGIDIPKTWKELIDACKALRDKGYASPMMGYSLDSSGCLMNTVAYPLFTATLSEDQKALALANDLDPAAGESMRPALEAVEELFSSGCIDLKECDKIKDNYDAVIMRFFEGDVPMMICTADTVSGTKKRESQSESFSKAPFEYSFLPIPMTEEGGYFIDSPSVEFSVNKKCDNLDMTNEFMRFLITKKTLNEMASVKRLLTSTTDLSFDALYEPFGQVPADRIISPEMLGITDPLTVQIRVASFRVGTGDITIDKAVKLYGTFE